jgi:hypothetical protein
MNTSCIQLLHNTALDRGARRAGYPEPRICLTRQWRGVPVSAGSRSHGASCSKRRARIAGSFSHLRAIIMPSRAHGAAIGSPAARQPEWRQLGDVGGKDVGSASAEGRWVDGVKLPRAQRCPASPTAHNHGDALHKNHAAVAGVLAL